MTIAVLNNEMYQSDERIFVGWVNGRQAASKRFTRDLSIVPGCPLSRKNIAMLIVVYEKSFKIF